MEFLKDQPTRLVLIGAAAALVAGAVIAGAMVAGGRGEKTAPPPASQGGLVVETGAPDDGRLDPAKPLRCFVAGQFVWTGWDHLGEPTPYYAARSSYAGSIDLAKGRFGLAGFRSLTTAAQPVASIANCATDLLIGGEPLDAGASYIFPCTMVRRETCAPPHRDK